MINVGFLYPKETILKYHLTSRECIVIDWLVYFIDSGKQEYIDRSEGRYYWISYEKVIQDLGDSINIHSIRSVYSLMFRLVEKGVLTKFVSGRNHIKRVHFKFNPEVKEELRSGVKTMPNDPFGLAEEATKIVGIHPEVLDILASLSKIKIGENKLFSFKHPDQGGKVTKSLLNFNRKILDLYQGRFTRNKYILSEQFIKRNKSLISDENFSKIRDCKGNWIKVKSLIMSSVKNYILWFSPVRQPLSKSWLPRDVSRWIYEDRNQASIFIACIMKIPESIESQFSDKVVEGIPDNIYSEAIKLKDDFFPNIDSDITNQFWFNVNKVYKIEIKLRKKYKDNYMVSLWLESDKEGAWSAKYLKWLRTCWGEDTKNFLLVKHIGPKGKPWKKWIYSDEDLAESSISETIYSDTKEE